MYICLSPTFIITLLWIFSQSTITTQDHQAELRDYCLNESFNVSCPTDHVILLRSALYGRMRPGRCINGKGQIDCSVEVLYYMDPQCSGRQSCTVGVRELVDVKTPCQKDFSLYLEASYSCVKVSGSKTCVSDQYRVLDTDGSFLSLSSQVGSEACPWVISVSAGQRINVTVYDLTERRRQEWLDDNCAAALIITEGRSSTRHALCRSQRRVNHVFTSASNTLVMFITGYQRSLHETASIQHLIHYQAVGCADLSIPTDSWLTRLGNKLTVRCNNSAHSWNLNCEGSSWIGPLGNCSQTSAWTRPVTTSTMSGVLLAILAGVILGVAIGTAMLAFIYCIQKGGRRHMKHGEHVVLSVLPDDPGSTLKPSAHCRLHGHQSPQSERRRAKADDNISSCSAPLGRSLPLWPSGVAPGRRVYESARCADDAMMTHWRHPITYHEFAETRPCAVHS